MIEIREERTKFYDIYQELYSNLIDEKGMYGKVLYHYTSPEALISILKQAENKKECDTISLHFTRADCLNDKTEGNEFFKLYKETLDQLLEENQFSREFYDFLCNIEHKNIFWSEEDPFSLYPFKECDTFICSFSEGSDSLAMWNYYSKNDQYEGYNLGIQFKEKSELSKSFLNLEVDAEIALFRVIYDSNKIKECLGEFILKLFEKCDLKCEIDRYCIENDIRLASTILRYIVKNKAFKHEEECRFLINVAKENCSDIIDFRAKKGILIPFINAEFEKKFLKRITIGPLIEKEIAQNTLEIFLKKNGYKLQYDGSTDDGIQIKSSEVPIRY